MLRAKAWQDPRAMVGGSDAGAHLDRMCGTNYPTTFLGDCLRNRKLVPVERAVQMMTQQPAELFGLRDRGPVAEGVTPTCSSSIPPPSGSEPARLVNDLPGGAPRLVAELDRRGAGAGQRGRDGGRRSCHRSDPRHRAPLGA